MTVLSLFTGGSPVREGDPMMTLNYFLSSRTTREDSLIVFHVYSIVKRLSKQFRVIVIAKNSQKFQKTINKKIDSFLNQMTDIINLIFFSYCWIKPDFAEHEIFILLLYRLGKGIGNGFFFFFCIPYLSKKKWPMFFFWAFSVDTQLSQTGLELVIFLFGANTNTNRRKWIMDQNTIQTSLEEKRKRASISFLQTCRLMCTRSPGNINNRWNGLLLFF